MFVFSRITADSNTSLEERESERRDKLFGDCSLPGKSIGRCVYKVLGNRNWIEGITPPPPTSFHLHFLSPPCCVRHHRHHPHQHYRYTTTSTITIIISPLWLIAATTDAAAALPIMRLSSFLPLSFLLSFFLSSIHSFLQSFILSQSFFLLPAPQVFALFAAAVLPAIFDRQTEEHWAGVEPR